MSNLPPGVSDSMIPGNRPEDVEYDRATTALTELAADFGTGITDDATDDELEALDALVLAFLAFVDTYRREVE